MALSVSNPWELSRMRNTAPCQQAQPERAMKLQVHAEGECILAYQFRTSDEAAEVYRILRDYFPKAQFVFEQA